MIASEEVALSHNAAGGEIVWVYSEKAPVDFAHSLGNTQGLPYFFQFLRILLGC